MPRRSPVVLGIVASVALTLAMARFVASAQDRTPATPAKLTVSWRVYDKKQLLTTTALSDDALRGRAVWVQRCALCHDGLGQPTYKTMGPWLDGDLVESLGENTTREVIAAGSSRMPGFRYALRPQQVDQLIAFLKTVTHDQKPTAAQLAEAQEILGGNE